MELGRRMGGWWLGGSEGGCRQDQRAVLIRAFEGRWRSGDRALRGRMGVRERERESRAAVHAGERAGGGGRGKKRGCRARGGSNGADGPEGRRWVAMLRWVEATTSKSDFRSTCYASASSTLRIPSTFPLFFFLPPLSDHTCFLHA